MTKRTLWPQIAGMAAALVLGACATATPYQPKTSGPNGFGFSETKIEPGKYRVNFRGNASTDRATVENYILLRAAELSLQDGLGHFIIIEEDEAGTSNFNTTGFNNNFGFGGGFRNRGFGGGIGGTTSSRTRERRIFDIGVLVQGFPGIKAEDNYQAFNAEDVVQNLRPVALRPR